MTLNRIVFARLVASLFASGMAVSTVAGCATSQKRDIQVPRFDRLHVAVFVDETETGEVGLILTEAVQTVVWNKDPESLAMSFDERSVTLDGTVRALTETAEGDERVLRVRVEAKLVGRDGVVVNDIGLVDSIERYPASGDAASLSAARRNALERATWKMAKHLVNEIDRLGRASVNHPPPN